MQDKLTAVFSYDVYLFGSLVMNILQVETC